MAAGQSPGFQQIVEVLTSTESVRGCMVNSDRSHLQALQNLLGWTIGGFDTRPTEAAQELKQTDRLQVLVTYRQPSDPGDPPRVAMYDYLADTIFAMPMRPVEPSVRAPDFQDMQGNIIKPKWVEINREAVVKIPRPDPKFVANRYPYQLPAVRGNHEWQRAAQHWILWYFHFPDEEQSDPGDQVINFDIRRALEQVVNSGGFTKVDYVWYRNPGMSVPDMFHVQVFWIVPP